MERLTDTALSSEPPRKPLHRVVCWVVGHDDGVLRRPTRLCLRCGRCGRLTTGWDVQPSRLVMVGSVGAPMLPSTAAPSSRMATPSTVRAPERVRPRKGGRLIGTSFGVSASTYADRQQPQSDATAQAQGARRSEGGWSRAVYPVHVR